MDTLHCSLRRLVHATVKAGATQFAEVVCAVLLLQRSEDRFYHEPHSELVVATMSLKSSRAHNEPSVTMNGIPS